MINRGPTEADFQLKQEGLSSHDDHEKLLAKASASSALATSSSSAASQWLKLKSDPRIVRVSRAFGGKDRHSKVCTIKGLRDRRVRLSVPTAIHLYDLQDRLGLNQPSKVVDWLLNAAKHEIDELPPLPIPPVNFTLGTYPSLVSQDTSSIWKSSKLKEVSGELVTDKVNWLKRNEEEDDGKQGSNIEDVLPNHNPSFLGLLNNVHPLGYNQLEPSGGDDVGHLTNLGFVNQGDINGVNFPSSTLSLSTQPYFPSHVGAMENMDPRQINLHYQMLMSNSSSQNLTNSDLHSSQNLMMSQSGRPFSFGKFNFKQN